MAAQRGAGIVGVNPLHALFPHDPGTRSPYSPSSRLFLQRRCTSTSKPIARVRRVRGGAQRWSQSPAFQARLQALRDARAGRLRGRRRGQVRGAASCSTRTSASSISAAGSARARAFRAFQRERGRAAAPPRAVRGAAGALPRATIPAMWGWPRWPEPYRDPRRAGGGARSPRHMPSASSSTSTCSGRPTCSSQARGHARARARPGRRAVSATSRCRVDRGGAEAWANQDLYALGASVGAPPDDFNPTGRTGACRR